MKCNQVVRGLSCQFLLVAGCFLGFTRLQSATNNRVNEAIFRTVKSIEADTKIIKPKVCDIQNKTNDIIQVLDGQNSELDSFVTEMSSQLETIESKVDFNTVLLLSLIDGLL